MGVGQQRDRDLLVLSRHPLRNWPLKLPSCIGVPPEWGDRRVASRFL